MIKDLIVLDSVTKTISNPVLILAKKNMQKIGRILNYTNFSASIVGNGLNEISFDVNKYANGIKNPMWDDLKSLRHIIIPDFGAYEINVDYSDAEETVKSVTGVSTESELGQVYLYDFHVEDEEVRAIRDELKSDNPDWRYDETTSSWVQVPTVLLCDPNDTTKRSLLHRVLNEKAPHWEVDEKKCAKYVIRDEDETTVPELASEFKRVYTVDNQTVYDFLTGDVAQEANIVFCFDSINRKIWFKSAIDIDGKEYKNGSGITFVPQFCNIGEDTTIFVDKNKLVSDISISNNKDNVKNCFRIEGGDDVITNTLRAINMDGSNYIYLFDKFQSDDMSLELKNAIEEYKIYKDEKKDDYTGKDGVYTKLQEAYVKYNYYNHSMSPEISTDDPYIKYYKDNPARGCYEDIKNQITSYDFYLGVPSFKAYNERSFLGITRMVEEWVDVITDARYKFEIKNTSYNSTSHVWSGVIVFTKISDESKYYPQTESGEYIPSNYFDIKLKEDEENGQHALELTYTYQKMQKALSTADARIVDVGLADKQTDDELYAIFRKYGMQQLKAFLDGYETCIATLSGIIDKNSDAQKSYDVYKDLVDKKASADEIAKALDDLQKELDKLNITTPADKYEPQYTLWGIYQKRRNIVENVIKERQLDLDEWLEKIKTYSSEQARFTSEVNFQNWLKRKYGEEVGVNLYKEFCMFIREDSYVDTNKISDGYENNQLELQRIAQELLDNANKEIKIACKLQRSASISLKDLFLLKEYESWWEKFDLYNYIRVRTEDEIIKLKLISVDYNGDSQEDISVTFAEKIENVDGTISELESILDQASSISSSYGAVIRQSEKGKNASDTWYDVYTNGLNAAQVLLKASNDNEVTMSGAGIVCKRSDGSGFGDKQVRITGEGMYMTNDNWHTVSAIVGETEFVNPITGDRSLEYGIIAKNLVGELLVGNQMYIGNENGSVRIDGDGITLDGGKITWSNPISSDDAISSNAVSGLEAFQTNIVSSLGITTITSNSVISPKIVGGYLYITSSTNTVEINPNLEVIQGHTQSGKVIDVKHKKDDSWNDIFSVDTSGNLKITGEVNATSGYIGSGDNAWNIGSSSIWNGCNSMSSTTVGTYIGTDGFRNYKNSNSYVNISNGLLNANGAEITGSITATSFVAKSTYGNIEVGIDHGLSRDKTAITIDGSKYITAYASDSIMFNKYYKKDESGIMHATRSYIDASNDNLELCCGAAHMVISSNDTYDNKVVINCGVDIYGHVAASGFGGLYTSFTTSLFFGTIAALTNYIDIPITAPLGYAFVCIIGAQTYGSVSSVYVDYASSNSSFVRVWTPGENTSNKTVAVSVLFAS